MTILEYIRRGMSKLSFCIILEYKLVSYSEDSNEYLLCHRYNAISSSDDNVAFTTKDAFHKMCYIRDEI